MPTFNVGVTTKIGALGNVAEILFERVGNVFKKGNMGNRYVGMTESWSLLHGSQFPTDKTTPPKTHCAGHCRSGGYATE